MHVSALNFHGSQWKRNDGNQPLWLWPRSDVELGSEFTLTLQTTDSSSNGKQPPLARLRRRNSSITRYINDTDGAVAQSRIVFSSISSKCRGQVCTASFALVNGWYQLARQGIVRKQKRNNPEKAIGKITVKLFFLADHDHQVIIFPPREVANHPQLKVFLTT